jgi:hypothetical protein
MAMSRPSGDHTAVLSFPLPKRANGWIVGGGVIVKAGRSVSEGIGAIRTVGESKSGAVGTVKIVVTSTGDGTTFFPHPKRHRTIIQIQALEIISLFLCFKEAPTDLPLLKRDLFHAPVQFYSPNF